MVATKVTKATIQCFGFPPPVAASKPAEYVIAVPAKEIPMIIAILPVTGAGRKRSILFCPNLFTINPASIDTKPDMIIPNWAWEMAASEATPSTIVEAVIPLMAAI